MAEYTAASNGSLERSKDNDNNNSKTYNDMEPSGRKPYVPSSPVQGVNNSRYKRGRGKGKPWRVDAASWKEQMQVRKQVFSDFAVIEQDDEKHPHHNDDDEEEEETKGPLDDALTTTTASSETDEGIVAASNQQQQQQEQDTAKPSPESVQDALDSPDATLQRARKNLVMSDILAAPPPTPITPKAQKEYYQGPAAEEEAPNSAPDSLKRARASLSKVLARDSLRGVVLTTDALQRTRKSMVMADLYKKLTIAPLPTVTKDDDDKKVEETKRIVSEFASILQQAMLLDDSNSSSNDEDDNASDEATPNPKTRQSKDLSSTGDSKDDDDEQKQNSSVLLADLEDRLKTVHTSHHHTLETSGRAGLDPPPLEKKDPVSDQDSQNRGNVMGELQARMSSIYTDHHHVVTSLDKGLEDIVEEEETDEDIVEVEPETGIAADKEDMNADAEEESDGEVETPPLKKNANDNGIEPETSIDAVEEELISPKSRKWKDRIAKKRLSRSEDVGALEDLTPPIIDASPTSSDKAENDSDGKQPNQLLDKLRKLKAESNDSHGKQEPSQLVDQLKTSFMAFEDFLQSRGEEIDDLSFDEQTIQSIWTEVTVDDSVMEETVVEESVQNPQHQYMAALLSSRMFTDDFQKEKSTQSTEPSSDDLSFDEQTIQSVWTEVTVDESVMEETVVEETVQNSQNQYKATLLSSRMFADDLPKEESPQFLGPSGHFPVMPTISYDADDDDDMTQVTFDQSVLVDVNDNDDDPSSRSVNSGMQSDATGNAERQENESSATTLSEASKQRIAEIIRKDIWSRDVAVVESALDELCKEASSGPVHRLSIVRFGGVMAIIRAMDMNSSHERINVAACCLLEKLALDSDTQIAIGEVGGIPTIVGSMNHHADNIGVQEAACAALATISRPRLAAATANDDLTIEADGVVPALCTSMTRYSGNPKIQAKAFTALANFCMYNQERLTELSNLGGIIMLTMALQTPWEDKQEQHEAISNLAILLRCIAEQQSLKQVNKLSKAIKVEENKTQMKLSSRNSSPSKKNVDIPIVVETGDNHGDSKKLQEHDEQLSVQTTTNDKVDATLNDSSSSDSFHSLELLQSDEQRIKSTNSDSWHDAQAN